MQAGDYGLRPAVTAGKWCMIKLEAIADRAITVVALPTLLN